MPLPLHRIIIFVADVQKSATFYRNIFGFQPIPSDDPADAWLELDTGGCRLAFHKAHARKGIAEPTGSPNNPHKIVFFAKDVAKTRKTLTARGAKMGPVKKFGALRLCDGQDPEGHVFQISNRA